MLQYSYAWQSFTLVQLRVAIIHVTSRYEDEQKRRTIRTKSVAGMAGGAQRAHGGEGPNNDQPPGPSSIDHHTSLMFLNLRIFRYMITHLENSDTSMACIFHS